MKLRYVVVVLVGFATIASADMPIKRFWNCLKDNGQTEKELDEAFVKLMQQKTINAKLTQENEHLKNEVLELTKAYKSVEELYEQQKLEHKNEASRTQEDAAANTQEDQQKADGAKIWYKNNYVSHVACALAGGATVFAAGFGCYLYALKFLIEGK